MTPGRNSRKESKNHLFSFLDGKIDSIMGDKAEKDEKLKAICKLLRDNVSYYNWVGFYLVDQERKEDWRS